MEYEGQICRSPMERASFMLPVSVGCCYNQCYFCMLFKHLQYRELPLEQIEGELRRVQQAGGHPKGGQRPPGPPGGQAAAQGRPVFLEQPDLHHHEQDPQGISPQGEGRPGHGIAEDRELHGLQQGLQDPALSLVHLARFLSHSRAAWSATNSRVSASMSSKSARLPTLAGAWR